MLARTDDLDVTPRQKAALAARSIGLDLSWAAKSWVLNSVGGSPFLPRVARWQLYRLRGLDVRTPNVFPKCVITGGSDITIGEGTFINNSCFFEAVGRIAIGADCQFGMQVMIVTSHHPDDGDGGISRSPVGLGVTVGDRCWLGARVTVLPGVTIGDDCVIAAGSVVVSDCAPGGLYGGVPARRIRDRHPVPVEVAG